MTVIDRCQNTKALFCSTVINTGETIILWSITICEPGVFLCCQSCVSRLQLFPGQTQTLLEKKLVLRNAGNLATCTVGQNFPFLCYNFLLLNQNRNYYSIRVLSMFSPFPRNYRRTKVLKQTTDLLPTATKKLTQPQNISFQTLQKFRSEGLNFSWKVSVTISIYLCFWVVLKTLLS